MPVETDFDAVKDAINREKHGIGLPAAAGLLWADAIDRVDDRFDYGEVRRVAIGATSDGDIYVVVYTWRDGKRRIISVRRANERERRAHRDRHA